jgi:hypothetical protein
MVRTLGGWLIHVELGRSDGDGGGRGRESGGRGRTRGERTRACATRGVLCDRRVKERVVMGGRMGGGGDCQLKRVWALTAIFANARRQLTVHGGGGRGRGRRPEFDHREVVVCEG